MKQKELKYNPNALKEGFEKPAELLFNFRSCQETKNPLTNLPCRQAG